MEQFKGTKGNWIAIAYGLAREGKTKVVTESRKSILGFGRWICSTYGNELSDIKECEANAKLIASAPDLLEALQELYEMVAIEKEISLPISTHKKCEDAINKALK